MESPTRKLHSPKPSSPFEDELSTKTSSEVPRKFGSIKHKKKEVLDEAL